MMDIQTYHKARDIREESEAIYNATQKVGGFCEISIGGVKIGYSKTLAVKLLKAMNEYMTERENIFKEL